MLCKRLQMRPATNRRKTFFVSMSSEKSVAVSLDVFRRAYFRWRSQIEIEKTF